MDRRLSKARFEYCIAAYRTTYSICIMIYLTIAPVTRLHRVRNSFMEQCIRFYNRIPENVRECSISQFKRVVKRRLCIEGYLLPN